MDQSWADHPRAKDYMLMQCQVEKKEAGEHRLRESLEKESKLTALAGIAARLRETSETSIYLAFLVMNLEKRLRVSLRSILVL